MKVFIAWFVCMIVNILVCFMQSDRLAGGEAPMDAIILIVLNALCGCFAYYKILKYMNE